jgi:hypothetical protein
MVQYRTGEPSDADLLAYLLDDLAGARAEYVAAHLEHCEACKARVATLRRALGHLNELAEPDDDDPQRRSMLKARIHMEAAGAASRTPAGRLQPIRIGLAAAAMLALIIVLAPALIGAGSPDLRDLIGTDSSLEAPPNEPRVLPGDRPLPTADGALIPARPTVNPSELPFAPIMPASLPGANHLVEVTAYASGAFEAYYEGDDGLEFMVMQAPATSQGMSFSEGIDFQEIRIADVDAYLLFDDELNSVDQLSWVRGGVFFTLQALVVARNFLPLEEAIQVVERLIELQDNPETRHPTGAAT